VWHQWGVVGMRGLWWDNGSHILGEGRGLGVILNSSLAMGFNQLGTCLGLGIPSSFPFFPSLYLPWVDKHQMGIKG